MSDIQDQIILLAKINELSDVQLYIIKKKLELEKQLKKLKKNRKED
tara:strand:+ start:275 stop:412 length:138 start_codon:yes stop_codon:yes gene_type:complete